jgi:hypothetical protein
MMHHLTRLEKNKDFWFLSLLTFLFFLLRLPSLFEPYWYGDEGIYQTIGLALNQDRLLYGEVWDNKTPLLYYLYAALQSNQFTVRLVSLLFGVASVITFFFLAKELFTRPRQVFVTTSLFAVLLGLPLLEGNIANAENFILLPLLAGGYILLRNLKKESHYRSPATFFWSGFLAGMAFLVKTVAIFDFAAFLLFFFLVTFNGKFSFLSVKHSLYKERKPLLLIIGGFFLPFLLSLLFFLFKGTLTDYLKAAFFGNAVYVGVENTVIIFVLKLLLLSIFSAVIVRKRGTFSSHHLFIILWTGFSLFSSFFSQRPYTHYLLVLLPGFCLLAGLLYTRRKIQKRLVSAALILIFILAAAFFTYWSPKKTVAYYGNFISFVTGQKSLTEYASFFDPQTPRDTAIAQYLKRRMEKDESFYLWGNSAQIYFLANRIPPGRFTVAYHIINNPSAIKETEQVLKEKSPEYLVILPNVQPYPFPMYNYVQILNIQGAYIYERIH